MRKDVVVTWISVTSNEAEFNKLVNDLSRPQLRKIVKDNEVDPLRVQRLCETILLRLV